MRPGKRGLAFLTGFASGVLIALVTRALADERAGLPPFGVHVLHHAAMLGLLVVAAALVAVALWRTW